METNSSNLGASLALDPGAILAGAFAAAIRRAFPALEGPVDAMVSASRA